jgi:hypothetical protein
MYQPYGTGPVMLNLPFAKPKNYLTGVDWLISTLDYVTRRATGVGNMSQIVLELDRAPNEADLRQRLNQFAAQYPALFGRPGRAANLAPYWKMPSKKNIQPVSINVYREIKALTDAVNVPFKTPREHVAFHLVTDADRNYFAMTFDHRLFDARGAEAFLAMFHKWLKQPDAIPPVVPLEEPAHLNQWRKKFSAGKSVNRKLIELMANTSLRTLPMPKTPGRHRYSFRTIPFDHDQTASIIQTAEKEAGYLMLMPYTLAASVKAFHKIFSKNGQSDGHYVIPVSIDVRPLKKVQQQIFFNHVSFLFFKISPDIIEDFPALVSTIKQKMYDQIKSHLPANLARAALLMRIVPLPALDYVLRLMFRGEMASFNFSCIKESAYTPSHFIDSKVLNLFHMPRAPVPPGVGIFFNQFNGRINTVISHLEGMLDDESVEMLVDELKSSLGVNQCQA